MAKSPGEAPCNVPFEVDIAEFAIDLEIDRSDDTRLVRISACHLGGISYDQFVVFIKPMYLKAGWTSAGWLTDIDGFTGVELRS